VFKGCYKVVLVSLRVSILLVTAVFPGSEERNAMDLGLHVSYVY